MFPSCKGGALQRACARPPRRRRYPDLSPGRWAGVQDNRDQAAESWPPWTDAPVEFLDYDAFDDQGRLISRGGCDDA
jgi:hypothetical protein